MMTFGHSRSICAAIMLAAVAWVAVAQQAGETPAKQRRLSPPLELITLDGKILKIGKLKGHVVLLDFMTTVCPTCKLASAGLQRLYLELGPKGLRPVAVALNVEKPDPLREYGQEHRLTFTLATTARAAVGRYLSHPPDQPLMVPTLVLLDRRGRICSVEVGWKDEAALRASVLKLLAE
jgi:peroxiredoxin